MKLIKDQKNIFSYIDPDFSNWNVDEGISQPTCKVKEFRLEKDSKFSEIFRDAQMSQNAVIEWVEKNKQRISQIRKLLFLPT